MVMLFDDENTVLDVLVFSVGRGINVSEEKSSSWKKKEKRPLYYVSRRK
jgi:hypothetical protein